MVTAQGRQTGQWVPLLTPFVVGWFFFLISSLSLGGRQGKVIGGLRTVSNLNPQSSPVR